MVFDRQAKGFLHEPSSRIIEKFVQRMERQEERIDNMMSSVENFFAEGAPQKLKEGAETAIGKATNIFDDILGFDASGLAKSIVGNTAAIGDSFNISMGKMASGIGRFLSRDPKEKKTLFDQADDIAQLTGHALHAGSIYTHDIHLEGLWLSMRDKEFKQMAESLKFIQLSDSEAAGQMHILAKFERAKARIEKIREILFGKEKDIAVQQLDRLVEIRSILEKSTGMRVAKAKTQEDFGIFGKIQGYLMRSYKVGSKSNEQKTLWEKFAYPLGKDKSKKLFNWSKKQHDLTEKMFNFVDAAMNPGSIYTHDIHVEKHNKKMFKFADKEQKDRKKMLDYEKITAEAAKVSGFAAGVGLMGMFGTSTAAAGFATFMTLGPILLGLGALGLALGAIFDPEIMNDLVGLADSFVRDVWPSIKDLGKALFNMLSSFASPMLDLIKAVMPPLTEFVNNLAKMFTAITPLMTDLVKTTLPIFQGIFEKVFEVFNKMMPVIESFFKAILPIINTLMTIGGYVFDVLFVLVDLFTDLAASILPEFISITKSLGEIFTAITKIVYPILIPVVKALLYVVLWPMIQVFKYIVEGVSWPLRLMTWLVAKVATAISNWPTFFAVFLMITDKLGILSKIGSGLLKSVDILLLGVRDLVKLSGRVLGKVFGFFNWIAKGLGKILIDFTIPETSKAVGIVFTKIGTFFKWIVSSIKAVSETATFTGKIAGFFVKVGSFFKSLLEFGKFIDTVFLGISKVFGFLGRFLGGFLMFFKVLAWPITILFGIIDFIRGFTSEKGGFWAKLKAGIWGVINGLIEIPVRIIGWIVDLFGFEGTGDKILGFLKESFMKVFSFDFWWNVFLDYTPIGALIKGVKWLIGWFKKDSAANENKGKAIFTSFTQWFNELIDSFFGWFRDLKDKLIGWISAIPGGSMLLSAFGIEETKKDIPMPAQINTSSQRFNDINREMENNAKNSNERQKQEAEKTRDTLEKAIDKIGERTDSKNTSTITYNGDGSANSSGPSIRIPTEPENMGLLLHAVSVR